MFDEQSSPAKRQLLLALIFGAAITVVIAMLLVGLDAFAVGLSLGSYFLGAILIFRSFNRGFPHGVIGSGNLVTLLRYALVSGVVAALIAPNQPWLLVFIALFALILDGFDGYLARKEKLTSDFGARFDMEVDSYLGLILAINLFVEGSLGPWVLLLGIPRYLFVFAARFLPWINNALPARLSRKVVAVTQVGVLIGLNAPLLPVLLDTLVALIGMALLLWSFARDLLWLARARNQVEGQTN